MTSPYDHIAILFNPNSTGDAPSMAQQLADEIAKSQADIRCKATLTPTKRAGHAIELAENIALKYKRPLIISVSGDGGYNEVVNGAMRAKAKSSKSNPLVAVVGAGNANDHRRVMRDESLISLIKQAEPRPLDVLRLTAVANNFQLERYAHSYIGLGITSQVGYQLNKHDATFLTEMKLIISTFFKLKPFTVEYDGISRRCDNLIFANINEMAKVVQLDDDNTVRDGKFEVVEMRHTGKLIMLLRLIKAAIFGFRRSPQYSSYSFALPDKNLIQLDGEIEELPAKCMVKIKSMHRAIDSLY